MTSRLLARRPLQLGGLVLAATTLGVAAAPAALAEETPAPQTEPSATTSAPAPELLTPPDQTDTGATTNTTSTGTTADAGSSTSSSSASTSSGSPATSSSAEQPTASTTTPTGAHFGTGKLALDLVTDDLPDGEDLDATGARLHLQFSQVEGAPSTAGGTCTIDYDSFAGCTFDADSTVPLRNGFPHLPDNSVFTLTLVSPPTSGQLLDAPTTPLQGYSTTGPSAQIYPTVFVGLPVEHGYRTLGVALTGDAPLAGAGFELCPAVDRACDPDADPLTATTDASGLATFPGAHLPGDYLVVQTSGPAGSASPSVAPRAFAVPAATSVGTRDTAFRLTVAGPTTTPPTTAPRTTGAATAAAPTVAAGRQQTITAGGFTPGETVRGTLYSTPVDLGTAVADAQGVATFTFTLPAGFEPGTHTVTAVGLTSGATSSVTFTVTAAGTPALAHTGVEVAPLLGLGALALSGGAVLTVAGTRRRRTA
ncbi:prealbumin-like fold domain-containing protein [Klenkia taihuensis]|uniref:Uncharacterized protein n=1 Tax=Klenkia taihuensis TaxID=1225127 RepID=A0A1I1NHI7_9ACTN|nr:prealbumin-like fold domain-containing protein [Klenkia taihuensis]GHE11933.1 hypothetical protein GCM10011381_27600 [Klenkia taihuensis]SFC97099.1 hypothetical protein SAMN05661030_2129 [Klenkia taihuensis]